MPTQNEKVDNKSENLLPIPAPMWVLTILLVDLLRID